MTPRRGVFQITEEGKKALARNPARIDVKFLEQYPSFVEFREVSRRQETQERGATSDAEAQTPEEAIEDAHQRLRNALAQDLLTRIRAASPSFFERLVVELLVKMGYGGSRRDAGETVGQSGDGGIDGIIKEDRLGLDVIYLQAKR